MFVVQKTAKKKKRKKKKKFVRGRVLLHVTALQRRASAHARARTRWRYGASSTSFTLGPLTISGQPQWRISERNPDHANLTCPSLLDGTKNGRRKIIFFFLALCETLCSLYTLLIKMKLNTQIQMLKPATSNEKTRPAARVMKSPQEAPPQNFPEPLSTQDALPLDGEFATFNSTLNR